jgi:hypothetical protein
MTAVVRPARLRSTPPGFGNGLTSDRRYAVTTEEEIYELAEDFVRFQLRLARVSLKALPRGARRGAAATLHRGLKAMLTGGTRISGIVEEELERLASASEEPPEAPRRKVAVTRTATQRRASKPLTPVA